MRQNVKKVADGLRARSHLRARLRRAKEIRIFSCHFGRKTAVNDKRGVNGLGSRPSLGAQRRVKVCHAGVKGRRAA
jgi:hypothetical protein